MILEKFFEVGNPQNVFGGDKERSQVARRLLEKEGYALLQGSAMLWKGKCPSIIGSNSVIPKMGIGRLNSVCPVLGKLTVNELFLGIFCYLNLDVLSLVDGDIAFNTEHGPERGTLGGKLSVRISAHMSRSLTIVDQHSRVGGFAKEMEILISHVSVHKVEIRICGESNLNGFRFEILGRGLRDYGISDSCRVEAEEFGDLRVYSIFDK